MDRSGRALRGALRSRSPLDLVLGAWARIAVKALRIYDQLGLLSPTFTDPATGYRRYRPGQIRTGQLISVLRGADLTLADIGLILDDINRDVDAAIRRLDALLADFTRRHADRQLLIHHVQATLSLGGDPMFPVQTRHVPAQRVMSIQRRLHGHETDSFVREAKKAFADHLGGVEPTGPFTLIFHGMVDADHDGPLEAVLPCPAEIQPHERIGIRTEPGHDEAYTTITKAQWDYPAILAAYDAVACSSEVAAWPGSRLSCREVYRAEPDAIGPDDAVCDVAYPLGEPQGNTAQIME